MQKEEQYMNTSISIQNNIDKLRKELFDQLYNDDEILRNRKKRKDRYEYKTFSIKNVKTAEANGWELHQKNKQSWRMKKLKKHDLFFEDRVWGIFSMMNFSYLNRDRNLRINYSEDPNIKGKQIDVLAIDDETILIVECKSSKERKRRGSYQKDIHEFALLKSQIDSFLRRIFEKQRKIAWIFCTENITLSNSDKARLEENGIKYFTQDDIFYFEQLTSLLGSVTKYQLFARLFENQTIPALKNRVPAIKGKMGGNTFYSFSIEPETLLKISFILHRTNTSEESLITYQRMVKKNRLVEIDKYISAGNFFPNSVIININSKDELQFDKVSCTEHDSKVSLGILHLPKMYKSAFIIDGQHRLYGFGKNERRLTETIPVVAFENLLPKVQSQMFVDINHKQKSVPANIIKSLASELMWNSKFPDAAISALKSKLAQELTNREESPLFGRIILGEEKKTQTKCITLTYIFDYALNKTNFFAVVQRKKVRAFGPLYDGDLAEQTLKKAYNFFLKVFQLVEMNLQEQWDMGSSEGGFISRNIGISSIFTITWDILEKNGDCEVKRLYEKNSDELFEIVKPKLQLVIDFIKGLTPAELVNYIKQYGSSGVQKVRREFQRVIYKHDNNFVPDGLLQYIKDSSGEHNQEVKDLSSDLQRKINIFVIETLKDIHGDSWWIKSVPIDVQKACATKAIDNRSTEPHENFLLLLDYQRIISDKENWKIFSETFTPPGYESKSKSSRLEWFVPFNNIRNKLSHPERDVVTEDEYHYLKDLVEWLNPRITF